MQMKGLSQAEIARQLNYERTTVCRHLNSGIRSLDTAAEYASVLSIPLTTLLPKTENSWEKIGENKTLGIDIGIRKIIPESINKEDNYEKP